MAFAGQTILHDISLSVDKGKSYAILGQSGVGKSLLLKIMAGLIVPTGGVVQLQSSNLGMLFQKNALFDSLTAWENLDFTLRERTSMAAAQRRQMALQYLDWVELTGKGDLYPDELSGGMQKRLAIARALILKPQVIFYDEPTAGLDPITSRLISELILRLSQEINSTMVVITSDIFRAFQMADTLGILQKTPQGTILKEVGSPQEARNSPDPYVQQFIQGRTELKAK